MAVVRDEIEEIFLLELEEMGVKPALLALLFRDGQPVHLVGRALEFPDIRIV